MSLGLAPRQADMFATTASFCNGRVAPGSIYGLLHRECHRLFADEMFADLFCDGVGRRSVPPMIVAVVMVLQRLEGCSDREAVERFCFDARWKYAAGGLSFDHPGFVHTVLVDMRARLARSEQPDRIFEVTLDAATRAGLVALEGLTLLAEVGQAVTLMARLVGQDVDVGEDVVFRIARRVAKNRIISTVDPDARHGHKTSARGFDGYKGHVAVDPDSELITATTVTAGNVGDASAAAELLADDLDTAEEQPPAEQPPDRPEARASQPAAGEPEQPAGTVADGSAQAAAERAQSEGRLSVYGDSAYGKGEL